LWILWEYKIGKNIRSYILQIWDRQKFILCQAGFYNDPVDIKRGCTKGETNSLIIFNIIINVVLWVWKAGSVFSKISALFYADNGLIENRVPIKLQRGP